MAPSTAFPNLAIDTAITDPMQSKYFLKFPLDQDFSAHEIYAKEVKMKKYAHLMSEGDCFVPCVWDSFGGLNQVATEKLKGIMSLLASNNGWSRSTTIHRSWQLISVRLQLSVAQQISDRCNMY